MRRDKPRIDDGTWARAGHKRHQHESGMVVAYDHSHWCWRIEGRSEGWSTLSIAQREAERMVAEGWHPCTCGGLVQERRYSDGTSERLEAPELDSFGTPIRALHRCQPEAVVG